MVRGQRGQGPDSHGDVLLVGLRERDLTAFEQGVAAHRLDYEHLSDPRSRPWPP
jgi:hypothetical protein